MARVVWIVLTMATLACSRGPKRLEFEGLASADRIDIRLLNSVTTTDRAKIEAAAAFFERYHEGWMESFGGGATPMQIDFYRKGQRFFWFGVAPGALAYGSASRVVPESEITALAASLGVSWPPQ